MTSTHDPLLAAGPDAASGDERWRLAAHISRSLCAQHPAEILAVGVRGSLAHGDDREGSDIEIVAVTYRPGAGPAGTSREVDGWIVRLDAVGADEHLERARTLTAQWPLEADGYLNTKPLFDQVNWHQRLREAHLERLARAQIREFTELARQAWCSAASLYRRASRSTEWFDTDGALMLLAETRCAAALVEGLLTRTYYRSSADAARRTGISGLDLGQLHERLDEQATRLADRGAPVAATVEELGRG